MYASHFVGHTSLERLLEQAKSVRASMFVDSFALNDPTPTGMYNRRTLIQAGFFDGNIAHLWRWQLANALFSQDGQPFDPKRAQRAITATETALQAILDYLEDQHVVEAVIAFPKDLILMEGIRPGFLDYDPDTAGYSLIPLAHREVLHV